jgi:predicted TIM-barrel fold metal-dependent hydrolase
MPMPTPGTFPIIDTMMGIPHGPDDLAWRRMMAATLRDKESKEKFRFPAEYMYKELPAERTETGAEAVVAEMDRWGVERGLINVSFADEIALDALRSHPDRFIGAYHVDPNRGMEGIRELRRVVRELGVRAAGAFPCGYVPQVAINDRTMYPIYAACCELDIPIFCCAGVPGPRVPMWPQHVEHIDEVMYDFPELTFVTRHGCEPWQDLIVKLMLKWPNLYYSTSAFAPKHYPEAIVRYANTRGADKIIYAGYFPMGLSLERIMTDMPGVGFNDEVWPKFLRHNAARVLKLSDAATDAATDSTPTSTGGAS